MEDIIGTCTVPGNDGLRIMHVCYYALNFILFIVFRLTNKKEIVMGLLDSVKSLLGKWNGKRKRDDQESDSSTKV